MKGRSLTDTRIGMPLMAPEQLSEVELLKLLGDMQWSNLCGLLGCNSSQIANEAGERLYASFLSIHLAAGDAGSLSAFGEGDPLHAASCTRFYAGQFMEGFAAFGSAPVDPAFASGPDPFAAWGELRGPRAATTNALVARVAGNERLKVYRPAGLGGKEIPETAVRPPGIDEHARALQTGEIGGIDLSGEPLAAFGTGADPILYPICYESDMNGAGLLYFARYVAMMNYAERRYFLERPSPPLSHALAMHLSTAERKIFYFANAPHHDTVLLSLRATACEPSGPGAVTPSPETLCPLEFLFRHDLHRRSDGELMASSLARKRLVVPRRRKAVLAEAERFKARCRAGL